jgi:hypothetical protein
LPCAPLPFPGQSKSKVGFNDRSFQFSAEKSINQFVFLSDRTLIFVGAAMVQTPDRPFDSPDYHGCAITKQSAAFFGRKRHEVRLHCEAHLAGGMAMRCNGRIPVGLPCLAEPIAQRQIPKL